MKNFSLKSRTEVIADINDVDVIWDGTEQNPAYFIEEKSEIHLPVLDDIDLSEDIISTIRGYCDHEIRHKRYSQGWTSIVESKQVKNNPAMPQLINILEDMRIEQIKDREGEDANIFKMRFDLYNDKISKLKFNNKVSEALTSFLYTNHDIKVSMSDEVIAIRKEMQKYIDSVLISDSIYNVHKIANIIYDKFFKGDKDLENSLKDMAKGDSPDKDSSDTDSKDTKSSDKDSSDTESADSLEEESDSFSEESKEKSSHEEFEEKSKDSDVSKLESEKEESSYKEDSDSYKKKLDDIVKDLEASDIGENLREDIKSAYKDISENKDSHKKNFVSYTEGDIIISCSEKRNRKELTSRDSQWFESSNQDDINAIVKELVKFFKSKTSNYNVNGYKKGKNISKKRLSSFSMNLNSKPFYRNFNNNKIDQAITILLDMSGSMTSSLKEALSFCNILSKALIQLKVDFEVIGYTNVIVENQNTWNVIHKNNRHYTSPDPKVYFEISSFKEKKNFNEIVKNSIVAKKIFYERIEAYDKNNLLWHFNNTFENDDGSSLLYAAKRLNSFAKSNQRKTLFHISDGRPANTGHKHGFSNKYAESYFKKVINLINKNTDINLFGFGFSKSDKISEYYGEDKSIFIPAFNSEFKKNIISQLKRTLNKSLIKV